MAGGAVTNITIIPYDRALPEISGRMPYTRPDQYLEKLGGLAMAGSAGLAVLAWRVKEEQGEDDTRTGG